MTQLSIFCASFATLLWSTPVLAGIQDISSMQQDANGNFDVICQDGRTETVDAQTIANNTVCPRNGNIKSQREPSSQEVVCTGNELHNWFWVTRVADEQQFGDFGDKLSLQTCQQIVNAAGNGVVCTGNELHNWFWVTRVADEQRFEERYSLETCLQVSSATP